MNESAFARRAASSICSCDGSISVPSSPYIMFCLTLLLPQSDGDQYCTTHTHTHTHTHANNNNTQNITTQQTKQSLSFEYPIHSAINQRLFCIPPMPKHISVSGHTIWKRSANRNLVAQTEACIGRQDTIIFARNGSCRAAVEIVRTNPVLIRNSSNTMICVVVVVAVRRRR